MSNRISKHHLVREVEESTEEVTVPGEGDLTVLVRQISRAQYLHASRAVDDDGKVNVIRFERRIIAAGMVDPVLGEDDVAAWQKRPGSGPEIQAVLDKIMTWSGFRQGAPKSGL
jgi:hypothetical protein